MRSGRRVVPLWVLFVVLVGLPLLELWTLLQVGQVIGAWWTILLLVLMSLLGGALLRREGSRAWRAFSTTLASGRLPHRELADGMLIMLAGALMLTPGFVTDAVALLLVAPGTRAVARSVLTAALARRLTYPGGVTPGRDARHPGDGPEGPVVRGEVVDP